MTTAHEMAARYAGARRRLMGPVVRAVAAPSVALAVLPEPEPTPDTASAAAIYAEAWQMVRRAASVHPITTIRCVVCIYYGISEADMMSEQRHKRIAGPRQVAMYLAKTLTPSSLPAIGRRFNRDHTTALRGIRKIADLRSQDPKFDADIAALTAQIEKEI